MFNKVLLTARVASRPIVEESETRFRVRYQKDYFTVVACGKAHEPASRLQKGEIIHIDGTLKNQFDGEKDGKRCYTAMVKTFFFYPDSVNENL